MSRNRLNDPAQLVAALRAFDVSFAQARATYEELILKFPNAVTLLLAYAEFLETVANDHTHAQDLKRWTKESLSVTPQPGGPASRR